MEVELTGSGSKKKSLGIIQPYDRLRNSPRAHLQRYVAIDLFDEHWLNDCWVKEQDFFDCKSRHFFFYIQISDQIYSGPLKVVSPFTFCYIIIYLFIGITISVFVTLFLLTYISFSLFTFVSFPSFFSLSFLLRYNFTNI